MSPSSRSSLCVVLGYEPLDSFYKATRARKAAAPGSSGVAGWVHRAGPSSGIANNRDSHVPGDGASSSPRTSLEPRRSAVLISALATGPPAGVGGGLGPF